MQNQKDKLHYLTLYLLKEKIDEISGVKWCLDIPLHSN